VKKRISNWELIISDAKERLWNRLGAKRPTRKEAIWEAVREILEGYRTLDEALGDASGMRQTRGRRYTRVGREITPAIIEKAVEMTSKWQGR